MCKQRKPGKLATGYWAWFNADGGRSAWKVRYCPVCAPESLAKLLKGSLSPGELNGVFDCISCGADASTDSDPIYLTLYLPGQEPMEYALQLDAACAAKLRIPITQNGSRLPDRGGLVGGPPPSNTDWANLVSMLDEG